MDDVGNYYKNKYRYNYVCACTVVNGILMIGPAHNIWNKAPADGITYFLVVGY